MPTDAPLQILPPWKAFIKRPGGRRTDTPCPGYTSKGPGAEPFFATPLKCLACNDCAELHLGDLGGWFVRCHHPATLAELKAYLAAREEFTAEELNELPARAASLLGEVLK